MKTKKMLVILFLLIVIGGIFVFSSINTKDDKPLARKYGTLNTELGSPIFGSPSAPITVIEVGDYQCVDCREWLLNVRPHLEQDYVKKEIINIVFMDALDAGKNSFDSSKSAYCSSEQGKFWEYHDQLLLNQQKIINATSDAEYLEIAKNLGLDLRIFKDCIESDKFEKKIKFSAYEIQKNGLSKIPTFVFVDSDGHSQKIVGLQPYSAFVDAINSIH